MSFDGYLIGIIVILVILTPLMSIYGFTKGYSLGVKDWNSHNPDERKDDPARKPKMPSYATDKKLEEMKILLDNIENYDGTDANQKEIY